MSFTEILEAIKSDFNKNIKDPKLKNSFEKQLLNLENTINKIIIDNQQEIIQLKNKIILKTEEYATKLEDRRKNEPSTNEIKSINYLPQNKQQFSIIISSDDKNKTSEDIEKMITKKISVAKLKIAVNGIRKINKNRLIIHCPIKNDAIVLSNEINDNIRNVHAEEVKKRRPRIILKGLHEDIHDDEIAPNLMAQNPDLEEIYKKDPAKNSLKVLKSFKTKYSKNCIIETSGDMRQLLVTKHKVNIGYQRVNVEDCHALTQCYHCQRFGHTALRCLDKTNPAKCNHCSGNHNTQNCTDKDSNPVCANCSHQNNTFKLSYDVNHNASSIKCLYRLKMMRIAQDRIDYS